VFAAPIRPVLDCPTYGDARALLASMGGPSMSAQSFGIVPAVRAVDAVMTPELERRVVEVHPELTFDCLGGGRRLPPKRDPAGELARQALLREWRCDLVDSVPSRLSGIGIPMDDALDALACAWTAGRWAAGTAEVLGEGTRDTRGLRARIVV
jgi:predicted RNase H-like nuclease